MNSPKPAIDIPSRARQQAVEPAPTPLPAPLPDGRGSETAETIPPQRRKLDAAAKQLICQHIARGHTLAAAARLVGVSERAIYKCKQRDPLFKLQLGEQKEQIADGCLKALEQAVADGHWRAGLHYMRLAYPDRFHYQPDTIPRKQHERWTTEVLRFLSTILSDDQLRQLQTQLSPAHPPR